MLNRLFIKNLVLVESCEVFLHSGFNVLTGETGAGKSIILSSLGLLLGERSDLSLIRQGAVSAMVEASFEDAGPLALLAEAGISCEPNQELVIRRELLASGKSRAYVNDQAVQLSFLKKLGEQLIEISSQHAHIELLEQGASVKLLDRYSDSQELLASFQASYSRVLFLRKAISDFHLQEQQRQRTIQTCQREIEEIEKVNPQEGEDDELFQQYTLLSDAADTADTMRELLSLLDGQDSSALMQLVHCRSFVQRLAEKNSKFEPHFDLFQRSVSELQELAFECTKSLENVENQELQFVELDKRLKELHGLKKKYGPMLGDCLAWKERQKAYLHEQELTNHSLDALQEELQIKEKEVNERAEKLYTVRLKGAKSISKAVTLELMQLNMVHAEFEVELERCPRCMHGDENVRLYLTPNRGESRCLVQDGASGGELARLQLAIKCVMLDKTPVGTILFDEIDANIGGETASIVGKKLATIGKSCQVIAVTHFAQVAVEADRHFRIQKIEKSERTTSHIQPLIKESEKHAEINRMLGGNSPTLAIFARSA